MRNNSKVSARYFPNRLERVIAREMILWKLFGRIHGSLSAPLTSDKRLSSNLIHCRLSRNVASGRSYLVVFATLVWQTAMIEFLRLLKGRLHGSIVNQGLEADHRCVLPIGYKKGKAYTGLRVNMDPRSLCWWSTSTVTRRLDHLKSWSLPLPLIAAAFFFWNSGSTMQMSQLGLLQSLLYTTLSQDLKLIPRVFPERWEVYRLSGDDPCPFN